MSAWFLLSVLTDGGAAGEWPLASVSVSDSGDGCTVGGGRRPHRRHPERGLVWR